MGTSNPTMTYPSGFASLHPGTCTALVSCPEHQKPSKTTDTKDLGLNGPRPFGTLIFRTLGQKYRWNTQMPRVHLHAAERPLASGGSSPSLSRAGLPPHGPPPVAAQPAGRRTVRADSLHLGSITAAIRRVHDVSPVV